MPLKIALLSPPYSSLTYSEPDWLPASMWRKGLRVAAPVGKGHIRAGVILDTATDADPKLTLRPVTWPLEAAPLLNAEYLEMVEQLASRQAIEPGRILGQVLPQGLRGTAKIRLRRFRDNQKPSLLDLRGLPQLTANELSDLGQEFMSGKIEILALREDSAASEICSLTCEPPWPVRPNALRQRELLDYLLEHGPRPRRTVLAAMPQCAPALSSLTLGGQIRIRPMTEEETDEQEEGLELLPPPDLPFTLNKDQQAALEVFALALDSGRPATHLLYGVTGSGKTAVYLELAQECLRRGKSMLLLAPELALVLKLRRDISARFPNFPVFFYHGYQNPAQRERVFRVLAERNCPCLVVGTRSALFTPLPPLGAIVLDEEHDASFKQDEGLNYQAKEVAWQRATRHNALLLLGSATPDVKTFHAARQNSFPLSRLPSRAGGGNLPKIELADIGKSAETMLAPASLIAIKDVIKRGEQAVILLNRRGYAPLMYCLDCKKAARCPNCDIGLTYHKRREQMVCHYCGYIRPFPTPCENCNSLNFLPMGQGTERLEERLATEDLAGLLPMRGGVLRLDRDSTRRPGKMEEILAAFARQEAQILVGTQMLSKGHHFPLVTLAVIADADLGLNLPDYRAAERTFQLLLQSAGRSGRGDRPGQVIIQTRDTSHYCWDFVRRGDYEGFYEHEIALREKRRYPPFIKLAMIRISFASEPATQAASQNLLREFSSSLRRIGRQMGAIMLGPAPAPLARISGRLRYQCLLKAENWQIIRQIYSTALRDALPPNLPRNWRISLDLDPLNML